MTQREVERYLLLLNDFPGMRVSGVIAPSNERAPRGTSSRSAIQAGRRLCLDRQSRIALSPAASNTQFSGAINGLFDTGDRALYRYIVSTSSRANCSSTQRVSRRRCSSGARWLEVWGNYSRTRPGFTLRDLDVKGESYSWNVRVGSRSSARAA